MDKREVITEEDVAPLRERLRQNIVAALIEKGKVPLPAEQAAHAPCEQSSNGLSCAAPGCEMPALANQLCETHDGSSAAGSAAVLKATAQLLAIEIEEAGKARYEPAENAKR